ncbi:MAG: hypothetical protein R2932_51090 [Caldilineaceae bacterium]
MAALGGSTHAHLGGYYGMIKRLDEALGRLLDALKSLGSWMTPSSSLRRTTAVISKTRNAEYKRSCHESSIRVPTAFHGPGFNGGGRLRQLVSLVDLPPTPLDAAGLPIPATMQGRSILPLLRGEQVAWPTDVFVQISESQIGRAIRTARWKYSVTVPGAGGSSAPGSDRYVEEFLYDLEADPHELTNLVHHAAYREVKAALRKRLIERMVEAGEGAPAIEEPSLDDAVPFVANRQRNPEIAQIRAAHIG